MRLMGGSLEYNRAVVRLDTYESRRLRKRENKMEASSNDACSPEAGKLPRYKGK